MDREMFRDLLAVISMHISEPQSRTFPLYEYMTLYQLHSLLLYISKSRGIFGTVAGGEKNSLAYHFAALNSFLYIKILYEKVN